MRTAWGPVSWVSFFFCPVQCVCVGRFLIAALAYDVHIRHTLLDCIVPILQTFAK